MSELQFPVEQLIISKYNNYTHTPLTTEELPLRDGISPAVTLGLE